MDLFRGGARCCQVRGCSHEGSDGIGVQGLEEGGAGYLSGRICGIGSYNCSWGLAGSGGKGGSADYLVGFGDPLPQLRLVFLERFLGLLRFFVHRLEDEIVIFFEYFFVVQITLR